MGLERSRIAGKREGAGGCRVGADLRQAGGGEIGDHALVGAAGIEGEQDENAADEVRIAGRPLNRERREDAGHAGGCGLTVMRAEARYSWVGTAAPQLSR